MIKRSVGVRGFIGGVNGAGSAGVGVRFNTRNQINKKEKKLYIHTCVGVGILDLAGACFTAPGGPGPGFVGVGTVDLAVTCFGSSCKAVLAAAGAVAAAGAGTAGGGGALAAVAFVVITIPVLVVRFYI